MAKRIDGYTNAEIAHQQERSERAVELVFAAGLEKLTAGQRERYLTALPDAKRRTLLIPFSLLPGEA